MALLIGWQGLTATGAGWLGKSLSRISLIILLQDKAKATVNLAL